ncbi:MAG: hypothetical protein CM15mV121_180 [uncultured marine virus]|nr:MAG: hypothetical protein CM15mV121_180 [uncultured marine virus]
MIEKQMLRLMLGKAFYTKYKGLYHLLYLQEI